MSLSFLLACLRFLLFPSFLLKNWQFLWELFLLFLPSVSIAKIALPRQLYLLNVFVSLWHCSCVIKKAWNSVPPENKHLFLTDVSASRLSLSWLQTAFWSGPHVTILSLSQIPGKSSKGQTKPHKHIYSSAYSHGLLTKASHMTKLNISRVRKYSPQMAKGVDTAFSSWKGVKSWGKIITQSTSQKFLFPKHPEKTLNRQSSWLKGQWNEKK